VKIQIYILILNRKAWNKIKNKEKLIINVSKYINHTILNEVDAVINACANRVGASISILKVSKQIELYILKCWRK